jgi:hypothetical protein
MPISGAREQRHEAKVLNGGCALASAVERGHDEVHEAVVEDAPEMALKTPEPERKKCGR